MSVNAVDGSIINHELGYEIQNREEAAAAALSRDSMLTELKYHALASLLSACCCAAFINSARNGKAPEE